MAYFREIPYTTLSQLNIDWLITGLQNIETDINNFVALNTIKYANPFDWDITSQYAMNTLVFNPADYTAYLSVKPVPSGVQIDNTDYWTPVFTLKDVLTAYRDAITPVLEQAGKPATTTIEKGQLFWIESGIYYATVKINQGDTVAIGTNCAATNISDKLLELLSSISTETAARENADSVLDEKIQAETAARENADSEINEKISRAAKKYFIFQADSYGNESNKWPALLAQFLGIESTDYIIIAHNGDAFATDQGTQDKFVTTLQDNAYRVSDPQSVTDIIICGGRNDYRKDQTAIENGIEEYNSKAKELFPNAKISVGFIGWDLNTTEIDNNKELYLSYGCSAYIKKAHSLGWNYLNGVEYIMHYSPYFQSDGKHPNSYGSKAIAEGIAAAYKTGFCEVKYSWRKIQTTPSGIATAFTSTENFISENLHNNSITVWPGQYKNIITINNTTITADGSTQYEIATIEPYYFNGSGWNVTAFPCSVLAKKDDGYTFVNLSGTLIINQRKVYIVFFGLSDNKESFFNGKIIEFTLSMNGPFTFPTLQ